jgi:hypothetical protein
MGRLDFSCHDPHAPQLRELQAALTAARLVGGQRAENAAERSVHARTGQAGFLAAPAGFDDTSRVGRPHAARSREATASSPLKPEEPL